MAIPSTAAAVSITLIGKRAGRTTIPVGVASQAAGDPVTTNNTAPIAIRVVQPRRHAAR
jgi:hypothetical protein